MNMLETWDVGVELARDEPWRPPVLVSPKFLPYFGWPSSDHAHSSDFILPHSNSWIHHLRSNGSIFLLFLLSQFSTYVLKKMQRLYNLGARKFVIAGLGLMGCIPSILAQSSDGMCSQEVNQLILPFNTNTKAMINQLSANLPGSKFSYIDIQNMFQDLLANARSYGT